MADPRMVSSNLGTNAEYGTFEADGSTIAYVASASGGSPAVERAVRIKPGSHNTIELVGDAERVEGKLILVEADGTCTVQVGGVMELAAGTGATLTEGAPIVGALGGASGTAEGYIRDCSASAVAEIRVARGCIEDATSSAAAHVRL